MTYIKHLTSNVKGDLDLDLGPCTLIVGDNAAGKSSLVAAVELGTTGRAKGIHAQPAAIMELAPEGATMLRSRLTLSDDAVVDFLVTGTTAKAKKPLWSININGDEAKVSKPLSQLIRTEVLEMFAKGVAGMRERLLTIACAEVDAEKLTAEFPDAFRTRWEAFWAKTSGSDPDRLLQASKALAKQLKDTRALVKGEVEPRPIARSDQEIAELRDTVLRAEADLATLRQKNRGTDKPTSQTDADFARRRVEALEGILRTQRFLSSLPAALVCLCCEQPVDTAWGPRAENTEKRLVKARSALAHPMLPPPVTVSDTPEVTEARNLLQTAQKALSQAQMADALASDWDEQSRKRARAEADEAVLAGLQKTAARLVAESLQGTVGKFEKLCSGYLPQGESLRVQLWDRKREVCRVGLVRDGERMRSWAVLCGGEQARVTAALAAAWGMVRKGQGMRIVIIDEVMMGPAMLKQLLESLHMAVYEGAIDQALVCVGPGAVGGEEWVRVDLDV